MGYHVCSCPPPRLFFRTASYIRCEWESLGYACRILLNIGEDVVNENNNSQRGYELKKAIDMKGYGGIVGGTRLGAHGEE